MFLSFFNGPEFLAVYLSMWALGIFFLFCLSCAVTTIASIHFKSKDNRDLLLNREELGYLARGPLGALDCALVYMGAIGTLRLNDDFTITKTDVATTQPLPLENEISRLMVPGQSMNIAELRFISKNFLEMHLIRQRLESAGLLISSAARSRFMILYYFTVWCLILFGLLRLVSGFENNKDVGFLIVILIVVSFGSRGLGAVFSDWIKTRTGKGNWVLNDKRQLHAELKTGAQQLDDPVHAPNMALAIALFGVAAMGSIPTPWSKALALPRSSTELNPSNDSSSCSSSDSDSSGSSSCGGGGCGGCGGGGGD